MKTIQKSISIIIMAFSFILSAETKIEYKDSDSPIAGQTYFIQSALGNNNRFLSEQFVSRDINGTLKIDDFDAGFDMQFTLLNAGEGLFYIKRKSTFRTNKCINLTSRRSAEISVCNNSELQKWRFTPTNDGYYIIQSEQTLQYLYVLYGNSRKDTPVIASNAIESEATKWKLCQVNRPITYNREFNLKPIENLCPTRLMKGDREFGSNGPRVSGKVILAPNKNVLLGLIQFKAKETRSDWSQVEGEWIKEVITLPSTHHINRVIYPNLNTTFDYTTTRAPSRGFKFTSGDSDINLSRLGLQKNGVAESLHFRGDTGGNDISDDNDCNDDTGIYRIVFKPVTVEITYTP